MVPDDAARVISPDRAPPSPGGAPIAASAVWSVRIAARILNVSTAYLYKLVDANLIPNRRQGSYIFFDRREVSAWLHERRGTSR